MRSHLIKHIRALLPLLGVLLFALPTQAQDPASAQRFLQQQHEAIEAALRRNSDVNLTPLLGELLDFDGITERTLDRHRDELTEEQRTEFATLLRQLIEKSYSGNLSATLNYELRYEGAEASGDEVIVRTVARNRRARREPPVELEYHLQHRDGRWRVVDVKAGVSSSLVTNWRRQVHRVLRRQGYDHLRERMQSRLAE